MSIDGYYYAPSARRKSEIVPNDPPKFRLSDWLVIVMACVIVAGFLFWIGPVMFRELKQEQRANQEAWDRLTPQEQAVERRVHQEREQAFWQGYGSRIAP